MTHTFTLRYPNLAEITEKAHVLFSTLRSNIRKFAKEHKHGFADFSRFKKRNLGTILFFVIVAIALLVGLKQVFSVAASGKNGLTAVGNDVKTTSINQDFNFQAYDKNKDLKGNLKYTVADVQLTNQIIIKGQKATAASGRTFLIFNLKLTNDSDESLYINSRNYVRVQPKGSTDKMAPEIHNDTVEVQPLSTKLTRIGMPVNATDEEFTLFVGEINGEKTEIPVRF